MEILTIVLTGQSNMVGSAPYIAELLPDYEIVNCAEGGTSIEEWQRGLHLYTRCMEMIREAGHPVTALFHFQGERDTGNRKLSKAWLNGTKSFVRDLRRDIAAWNGTKGYTGELPLIYAQLGAHPGDLPRLYWGYIQRQQAKLPGKVADASMIQTKDITPYCDGPHWCPDGYREIANRFTNKFIERKSDEYRQVLDG